jgi:tRNA threonylcarbamoyladenosine modification (KEOPS) complex Cgi121 subunit
LLKYIEEYGKYIEITGFRNVQIKDAETFLKIVSKERLLNTWVQFFNADLVATWQHLYFAVLNALLAFKNKTNISKSVSMETMLYASAQRQIRKAVEFMGVRSGSSNVALVVIGGSPAAVEAAFSAVSERIGAIADETVLDLSDEKVRCVRKAFGITEKELEAVMKEENAAQPIVDLVVERMALLSTQL